MNPTGFNTPQNIAEDKILDFFRSEGVFTPPEESKYVGFGPGIKQSVNMERMLHAVVKMWRTQTHTNPVVIQRALLDETINSLL